jgi:hypothetical protein
MAGALTISTLNNDTGVLATQNGMTGIAKAWVNFNGTTAAINGSFNVSSITKSTTGTYVVSYTTAMPNTNYAVTGNSSQTGAGGGNSVVNPNLNGVAHLTTSATIQVHNFSATVDSPFVQISVFSS